MEKGVQRVSLNVATEIKEKFVADAVKEGLTQTQFFIKLVLENNNNWAREAYQWVTHGDNKISDGTRSDK